MAETLQATRKDMSEDYEITHLKKEDIHLLSETFIECFKGDLFPDEPDVRRWFEESILGSLDPKSSHHATTLVILSPPSQTPRKILAFAHYYHLSPSSPQGWTTRWVSPTPFPSLNAEKLGPGFFEPMEVQHEKSMGGEEHLFLEVLGTVKEARGKGLGGKLVKWGNEEMERRGVNGYLDGSEMGVGLYKKLGYEIQEWQHEKAKAKPMKRFTKGKDADGVN